jgi:hypothetical protein
LPEDWDQRSDPQEQGQAPEPPVAPGLSPFRPRGGDRQRIGNGKETVEPFGLAVPPEELESMFLD